MLMRRLPDIAIRECVGELRAACRLPIDQAALEKLIDRLRPNFERILGHPDGTRRWADHGQRMRDNGRHLGALADFYAGRAGVVDEPALMRAFDAIHEDCTVRAESLPLAYEYCRDPPDARSQNDEKDEAQAVRARARVPEPV